MKNKILTVVAIGVVLAIGVLGFVAFKLSEQNQLLRDQQNKPANITTNPATTTATSAIKSKSGFRPIVLPPQTPTISAQEIAPYLNGVVEISCYDQIGNQADTGSGVLKRYPTNFNVLTNRHVVENQDCDFAINGPGTGAYSLSTTGRGPFNYYTDASLVKIAGPETQRVLGNGLIIKNNPDPPAVASLDYAVGDLRNCSKKVLVGSPVAIIGYPATGMLSASADSNVQISHQIVTFGAISGYDESPYSDGLPDVNYFVTAQMDAGNSGGAAIAKDALGLCFLGIPTWVNQGEYANTGMVQSVNNVMHTP